MLFLFLRLLVAIEGSKALGKLQIFAGVRCTIDRLTGRHIVPFPSVLSFLSHMVGCGFRLFQLGGIFGGDAGNVGFVLCLCFGNGVLQEAKNTVLHLLQFFHQRRLSVLLRPVQGAIFFEKALLFLKLLLSAVQLAGIRAIKSKQGDQLFLVQITGQHIVLYGFLDALFLLIAGGKFLLSAAVQPFYLLGCIFVHIPAFLLHQKQPQVCLAAFRVHVQNTVIIPLGIVPLAVRQRHLAALEQCVYIRPAAALLDDNRLLLLRGLFLFLRVKHLAYATNEILDEANPAHIVAHQNGQLLRQVVSVHVPVAGDEELALILAHHGKETAPLVFHPNGVEILRACADNDHHFR